MSRTLFHILFLITLSVFTVRIYAQNEDKPLSMFNEANALFEMGNFKEAVKLFSQLSRMNPDNANWMYLTGISYLEIPLEKEQAMEWLQKAIKNVSPESDPTLFDETQAPVETYYYLAKAYHRNYRFDDAIDILQVLKFKYVKNDAEFEAIIQKLIQECQNAKELVQNPVEMEVKNLGKNINSSFSEHSPVFSADESVLIFTSKREGSSSGLQTDDGQFREDIYVSYKVDDEWSEPISIGTNINTEGHEATIGLSADGQELYIYRDDDGDGNIYVSYLDGDQWSKPEKLGTGINTKYNEKHASLSADKRKLFFSSDRKDGFGGFDIYMSERTPDNQWGDAVNLGISINTPFDEEGPFIHPDGVTLFFSSKGHKTMGGFDIFISTLYTVDNTWDNPINLGYPINTPEDDVFYTPTVDGKRAFYSSFQNGGFGDDDIYLIGIAGAPVNPMTVYTGQLLLCDGKVPEEGYISIQEKDKDEDFGVYTPNSKTGKYLFILPTGKKFKVSYTAENNYEYSNDIQVSAGSSYQMNEKPLEIEPVVFGCPQDEVFAKFNANEILFTNESKAELDKAIALLKEFPHSTAQFTWTSNKHKQEYVVPRENNIRKYFESQKIESERILSSDVQQGQRKRIRILIIADDSEEMIASSKNAAQMLPVMDKELKGVKNDIEVQDILYDFNKDTTYQYFFNLNKLANWLIENPKAKIKLVGHTDSVGTDDYNMKLSNRRAEFAKQYLVKMGAKPENIETDGKGETMLIARGDADEIRKYNRRVEIHVIKQGKTKLVVSRVEVPQEYKYRKG